MKGLNRTLFSLRHKNIEFKKYRSSRNKRTFTLATFLIFTVLLLSFINSSNNLNLVHAHSLPVTEIPESNSIIKKGLPLPSKIIIDFSETRSEC